MTLLRKDNVGIVVHDRAAATAFFVELGLELEGAVLHVDHTLPVSRDVTDVRSNLWALCGDCNLGKADIWWPRHGSE